MSLIFGGQAGLNSVMFYNRNNKVKANRSKNGGIKVEVTPRDINSITKLGVTIEKIPFLRGMWLIVEFVLLNWKLYIIAFALPIALVLFQRLLNSEPPEIYINNAYYFMFTPPYHFFFLFGILLCAALFIKLTEVGKYHSAEHMVDKAYEDSQDISLHNVQKYSRVHRHCGTNFVIFILIFYIIFYYLIDNMFIVGFLSFSFGYEVFRVKNLWLQKALTPFYVFSYSLQWLLFTSKPKAKHLEVSIAAYQEIIKLNNTSANV
ncbi:DUF1385 domain-containing protein [Rossellomorea vietnamensis]|uniref:DUF1385 domain-containing protein n=1 Tax=Rossellomorea vietnamensis TaxID=218284 RepID=UPI001CCC7442|nr:DUF1385 domain-containing protein [Rossellomorea vietnamensis]MCA0151357.1 DUF1385 domain-containing protein [Rossellomorea vietnamensis]